MVDLRISLESSLFSSSSTLKRKTNVSRRRKQEGVFSKHQKLLLTSKSKSMEAPKERR
jgi:hypothetical protein